MASMSYCMFENTLGELGACIDRMEQAESQQELTEKMNEYERRAYAEMWRACRDFLAEHERLMNAENQRERDEHNAAFAEAIGE